MKTLTTAFAALVVVLAWSGPASAVGTTVLAREMYDGPVVELPKAAHWESETGCLRAAVREAKPKTCLEVPAGSRRAGNWVLVTTGKVAELEAVWQSVEKARRRCEARPSYGSPQSQEHRFWRWESATGECLHVSHDNRADESWL